MKKLFLVSAAVFSTILFGQRIEKGEFQVNAGVAMASRYGEGVGLYGGLDYGIRPDITVGVEARFGTHNYDYYYLSSYSYKGTWFGIGANGNYHFSRIFGLPNKFDVYAGATVGFNSFKYDYPAGWNSAWDAKYNSGVGVSAQVGGRYYFTNNFGINVEGNAGSLFSGAKAGISYKF